MNTFLSLTQQAQRDKYREFARNHLKGVAAALDARKVSQRDFLQLMAQNGHLSHTVPKEFAGQGEPFLSLVLLAEALGEWEPGVVLSLAAHAAVIELINEFGTTVQKSRYLPVLARGESIGALAFSEDSAGTDFEAVQTAFEEENGRVIVSGKKIWVINGDFAGLLVVAGRFGGELALCLVDLPQDKTVKMSPEGMQLGLRSASVNRLELCRAGASMDNLLGSAPAREQMLFAMDVSKVLLAAGCVGLCAEALNRSLFHARERRQFGQNIGQFQGVQWKIADMQCDTDGARLITYKAAWSKDHDRDNFSINAAMCKWFAARAARVQSGESLQILASRALLSESPAERAYRDGKVMEIVDGTQEFQKMLLNKLLKVDSPGQ